jgi:3-oxoacyl-[acyl-carrier-protein] synthase III
MQPAGHFDMLLGALSEAVEDRPEMKARTGLGIYVKTQTHNTVPCSPWLRDLFDAAGLPNWEVLTFSMTNCASALAAVHMFAGHDLPVVILAGEKAFHPAGCRLAVGLLGEAPVAALFVPLQDSLAARPVCASHVRHLPQFHRNPDDMEDDDRKALQTVFEAGFASFLIEVVTSNPDFIARRPVVIPYNLNVPLVARVLEKAGLADLLSPGHSGGFGHAFCSDPFLNLAALCVPPDAPVLLICAGMGVTYAAVALEAVLPAADTFFQPDNRRRHMVHRHLSALKDALSEVLERPVTQLTPDMQIDRDFDLDSVMFVQFLLSVEDRIPGLRFDPEVLAEAAFNKVSSLLDFLDSKTAQTEVA